MANPLKCDLCSKSATVHLTQIVNNKVHKVDLCEACAQAKGVTDPSGFSLADLLLKTSLNSEPAGNLRCEQCGFTSADFKLKMLAEHMNDLLPREQALKKIWGSDTYFNGRSMDVYIAKLRKYLKDDNQIEIVNIHGNGFRLVAPVVA